MSLQQIFAGEEMTDPFATVLRLFQTAIGYWVLGIGEQYTMRIDDKLLFQQVAAVGYKKLTATSNYDDDGPCLRNRPSRSVRTGRHVKTDCQTTVRVCRPCE